MSESPITVSMREHSVAKALFTAEVGRGDRTRLRHAGREAGGTWSEFIETSRKAEFDLLVEEHAPQNGAGAAILEVGDAWALVDYEPDWSGWSIEAAGATTDDAVSAIEAVLELLPPVPEPDPENPTIDVEVWMMHPMAGGVSRRKKIDALPLEATHLNYPDAVRHRAESLCAMEGPPEGGRLMLFHGPPGTGKTRFIQTLATEWSEWCDMHYVLDPDEMFSKAAYLNALMVDAEHTDKWRLVVLEDGDEFIDVGAKGKVGQGLSRLLNLADGFIGQATNVMVLVSTNVDHEDFQPAAVRAGRCFANIEFPPFPLAEAAEWLEAHDVAEAELPDDGGATLAHLYDALRRARALDRGDVPTGEFALPPAVW